MQKAKLPALFIGHGPLEFVLAENAFTRRWRRLREQIPTPKAILVISAHWETQSGTKIQATPFHKTIHDHSPSTPEINEINYDVRGNPELAEKIRDTVQRCKIELTDEWGLDQGSWIVLNHLFPDRDIPVLQMSINYTRPLAYHFEMGQDLAFLRNHGVLVIGSGNTVYNLRRSRKTIKKPFQWATDFDLTIKNLVEDRKFSDAVEIRRLDEFNEIAVPTLEHYIPFLYILGMIEQADSLNWFNEEIIYGGISMRSLWVEPSA